MIFSAKKIILEHEVVENAYLETVDGKFFKIHQDRPEHAEVNDEYEDFIIAPGLVDTHIHGYKSHDVMDNDREGLETISNEILKCGVTAWLPTTLTDTIENLNNVCQTIGQNYRDISGAKIKGIFLEGPFFTEEHAGAQNPKYMRDPSEEIFDKWQELSQNMIKKIAIAPEREDADKFIKYVTKQGVSVALAHSAASYESALEAVKAGANIFVHTYNGMSPLHHREPGMVGAALDAESVYAEVIADGYHVHPGAISILKKARGADETVLVTDCMRAGGMGEGKSTLGEYEVHVKDGKATLTESGNLGGSILELIEAVQNIVKWQIAPLEEAIRMASIVPARSVGIEDTCGKIEENLPADFIVIDEKANLKATFLDGKKVYTR